jgi:phosphoadenosine phosphosulfate reductase
MNKQFMDMSIENKAAKARDVIREAVQKFGKDKIAVAWTGGKDSSILIHLIQDTFDGAVPISVIFVDTGKHFPEVYQFRDDLVKKWNLNLINAQNVPVINATQGSVVKLQDLPNAMRDGVTQIGWEQNSFRIALDREPCCHLLKTVATNQAIVENQLDALIVGIRWDEQEARSNEQFFSPRTNPDHVRVHPILHFLWEEVWDYIKAHKIPRNPLYDQGFTSLGCYTCTQPNPEAKVERAGRAQDKEQTMARLRALGYF